MTRKFVPEINYINSPLLASVENEMILTNDIKIPNKKPGLLLL
jgi:hypothetical protein